MDGGKGESYPHQDAESVHCIEHSAAQKQHLCRCPAAVHRTAHKRHGGGGCEERYQSCRKSTRPAGPQPLACRAKFPLDAGSSGGRKMAGAATEGQRQRPGAGAESQLYQEPAYRTSSTWINQWMDTGDNKNLADAVRQVDNTTRAYTDADLIRRGGWTQAQIDEARKMNAALDAIPAWQRGVRQAADTISGITDAVAAAVLGAEVRRRRRGKKNIDATPEEPETGGAGGKGATNTPRVFSTF